LKYVIYRIYYDMIEIKVNAKLLALVSVLLCLTSCSRPEHVDVLVVGGGASGVSAGVQPARMGVPTMIVEETPWIGGMLTAAGVSCIDGN
jgi:heterodisulfide reductase subunit A-like polyferredoxin